MRNFLNYLVIISILLFTTNLFATETTIKKINKEKNTVIIKGSEADGFVKGNKVCFYNPTNSKKVACGTIRKNGKASSLVSVAAKAMPRIRKDFIVSTSQEKVLGVTVANQKSKDGLGGDVSVGDSTGSDAVIVSPFRVELSYMYVALLTSKSNSLKYDVLSSDTEGSKDSLWTSVDVMDSSPFSVGTSFMYHINRLFSVSLGLQYTFLYPTIVKSTYSYTNDNNHTDLELKESASTIGINSDFVAYRLYLGPHHSNFYFSAGLSFEMFSLTLKAAKTVIVKGAQTEESEFLNNIEAKLNVIGLRFGTGYEIYSKENLGFIFGVIGTVPVSGNPSYSGVNNDEHVSYLKSGLDVTQDLYNSLDVKKSFGLSVSLSSFIQF